MLISAADMQAHEFAVMSGGLDAATLMDRAAEGIVRLIGQYFPSPGTVVCYCGKGNNAGDALAVAARLHHLGWTVGIRLGAAPEALAELPRRHLGALERCAPLCGSADEVQALHQNGPLVLLDGLVGIGGRGALRGELASLAAEMNHLRTTAHAVTVAIDLPSGLDPDTGEAGDLTVIADITATIAIAKRGLVADGALAHVGRIAVIPVAGLELRMATDAEVLTPAMLRPLLPRRRFDMHKGQAGRIFIIAGSPTLPGAAALAALGALRGGAGLVTVCVKQNSYEAIAPKLPPEVMLRVVTAYSEALQGADVLAIGPGLGSQHDKEIRDVIYHAPQPMVIDADALNALARASVRELRFAKGPRLLTPHPGEMARLDPPIKGAPQLTRRAQAERFVAELPNATLLLKGSRTVITSMGRPTRFNTTGTPGMATGGMGDVLTGLLAALLAQGAGAHDAASLGSWLLGRAAEVALLYGSSEESLTASDVANHLGLACNSLRQMPF